MTVDLHPTDWATAVEYASVCGAVVVSGGTAVQPWLNTTGSRPAFLVHLRDIPDIDAVHDTSTQLQLGAMVTIDNPSLIPWFGREGPGWFATAAVRARATVVGNAVSRLSPAELGPLLTAVDGRVQTTSGQSLPVADVIGDGAGEGQLATAIRLRRPDRISFHRVSPRSRVSRIELGLCAAVGNGCGAALVVTPGGRPYPVAGGADGPCADFIGAVRERFIQLRADDQRGLDTITELARRVHHDLHTGTTAR
ncbi:FAD binding domain-containing protein [Mycobacterium sp. MS1601]|uniref:FAD binding domain-containing protein n=1 Tax=Mycobacterium sp. MS1601 TaxID=1936029 RepID=UPI0012F984B3|nr:FAD binding domain-containing protein [Mycobacterium sp. MS1601]